MSQIRKTVSLIRRFLVDRMFGRMLFMLISRLLIMYGVGQLSTPVLLAVFYAGLTEKNPRIIIAALLLWLGYAFWMVVGDRKNMLLYNRIYFRNQLSMQSHYINAAMEYDLGQYDRELKEGKLVELVDDGTDEVMNRYQNLFALLVKGATVLVLSAVIGIIGSWVIAIIFLLLAFLGILISNRLDKCESILSDRCFDAEAVLTDKLRNYYKNRETYHSAGLTDYWVDTLKKDIASLWTMTKEVHGITVLRNAMGILVKVCAYSALLWYAMFHPERIIRLVALPIGYQAMHAALDDFLYALSRIRVKSHIAEDLDEVDTLSSFRCQPRQEEVPGLEVEHLCLSFGERTVLKDVSFHISPGEKVFLVGANGCGKSTLLRAISGLLAGDQGCIRINGQDPYTCLPTIRRSLLYMVPAASSLFPFSPLDNIDLTENDPETAQRFLNLLGLRHLALSEEKTTQGLSEGEQQRICILRSLSGKVPFLLLDEPVSHMDAENASRVWEELFSRPEGILTIVHDFTEVAQKYNPRVIWLQNGRIAADGKYAYIMSHSPDFIRWCKKG